MTDPEPPSGEPVPHVPGGVHQAAAIGFDRAAAEYERARPSYPGDAVEHLVTTFALGPGCRVVDVAAGTGKLTRLLVPCGADLVAVEPVAGMRAQLALVLPAVEILDGTAEALPLPTGSADAIVAAQAFHWFDAPVALAECRRVLRPGGGLAMVFNVRDDTVAWVRRLTEVTGVETADRPHHGLIRSTFADHVAADGGYSAVSLATFRFEQVLDETGLVERVASQSWIGAMGRDEREEVLDRVRHLVHTHPDLVGSTSFSMPYDTEVWTCHRR